MYLFIYLYLCIVGKTNELSLGKRIKNILLYRNLDFTREPTL